MSVASVIVSSANYQRITIAIVTMRAHWLPIIIVSFSTIDSDVCGTSEQASSWFRKSVSPKDSVGMALSCYRCRSSPYLKWHKRKREPIDWFVFFTLIIFRTKLLPPNNIKWTHSNFCGIELKPDLNHRRRLAGRSKFDFLQYFWTAIQKTKEIFTNIATSASKRVDDRMMNGHPNTFISWFTLSLLRFYGWGAFVIRGWLL